MTPEDSRGSQSITWLNKIALSALNEAFPRQSITHLSVSLPLFSFSFFSPSASCLYAVLSRCVCGCRKVPKKPFRAVELERAQASGVRVTVMNHIEHILNLPRVRGTCVELLSLPFC